MFADRSLAWSDTKNVMWWDAALSKYVAYIRIDKTYPDVHASDPCTVWPGPGRSVGRCLIETEQLHDWSLAGCNSAGTGATVNVLTFDEFLSMQPKTVRQEHSEEEVRAWFDAVDLDGSGTLSVNEFFLWTLQKEAMKDMKGMRAIFQSSRVGPPAKETKRSGENRGKK